MDVRTVVMSIISVAIGVILISSLLAPIASDAMESLAEIDTTWSTLIGVTVVMSILSLIVLVLYNYTSKN